VAPHLPRVLIVAGSDSGGGAGLQGDIKTVTALGGYAASAVTAITVQDTRRVHAVEFLSPALVRAQIDAVLDDVGADAVKTGMLGAAATIIAVADALGARDGLAPIVVDPVMVATSGDALAGEGAAEALRARLFPLAAVVTPNIPEAEALTGRRIETVEDMGRAAAEMLAMGPRAVLLKGGHGASDQISDVLLEAGGAPQVFTHRRIESRSTHGTGCALASALATGLAEGRPLPEAVARARAFVRAAIAPGLDLGEGAGPLNHLAGARTLGETRR